MTATAYHGISQQEYNRRIRAWTRARSSENAKGNCWHPRFVERPCIASVQKRCSLEDSHPGLSIFETAGHQNRW